MSSLLEWSHIGTNVVLGEAQPTVYSLGPQSHAVPIFLVTKCIIRIIYLAIGQIPTLVHGVRTSIERKTK